MRKAALIIVGMFMIVSAIEATNSHLSTIKMRTNYTNNDVVSFVERGIHFYVFLNGDFEYTTHYNHSYIDYNGRRIQTNKINIRRDYSKKITKIGNVYITYDYRGNVARIGTVCINYQQGYLSRVGDLTVRFDRNGFPSYYGQVKYNAPFYHENSNLSINLNFGDVCNYNDVYFYRKDFRTNYFRLKEDQNFYYYKARANAKIGTRSTILQRRKPVVNKNITRTRDRETTSPPRNTSTTRSVNHVEKGRESDRKTRDVTRTNFYMKDINNVTTSRISPSKSNQGRKN